MVPTIPTPTPPVLLLTRPVDRSEAFAQALRHDTDSPFTCVISSLIGITVTGPLPDMATFRGVIFSSVSAVRAYSALSGGSGLPCYVVGSSTAKAARAAGFCPRSADGDAEDLIALVKGDAPSGPLLHLRGTHSRGDIAQRLGAAGIETREAVIYDQSLGDLNDRARAVLAGPGPVIVPLFSPRTAARFAEQAPRLSSCWVVAMSAAVAKTLGTARPGRLLTAARPTGTEMRKMVAMLMDEARTLEGGQTAQ